MTVRDVYAWLNEFCPFDTQEAYDNSGLICGDMDQQVEHVLFALDCTDAVLDQAEEKQVQLIITHHPLLFGGTKQVSEQTFEGHLLRRMIRSNISMIACHTCLDMAKGGINDILAQKAGLSSVSGEGFFRAGDLPEPMIAADAAWMLSQKLNTVVRIHGDRSRMITRIGMCSGAGSELWKTAPENGCEAFMTGEVKHHHALEADYNGVTIFECGHYETELPGIFALADALQIAADALQWNMHCFKADN